MYTKNVEVTTDTEQSTEFRTRCVNHRQVQNTSQNTGISGSICKKVNYQYTQSQKGNKY